MVVKVAINGYGTIGKRVADAIDAQDDMEIIGVTKTRPSFGCDLAVRKGYPLYCTYDAEDKIAAFGPAGYDCKGVYPTCFLSQILSSIVRQEKLVHKTRNSTKRQVLSGSSKVAKSTL